MDETATYQQEYETLELLVGRGAATGYPLTITQSPAGEAQGLCRLSPSDEEFRLALQRLAEPRSRSGEAGGSDERFLAGFGGHLFEALFPAPIAAIYRASLALARGEGKGLRLRLRVEAPELAALPWEYLRDPMEDRFLALSPETPLVRYVPLPLPSRPIAVSPPLRVLVVLSSPRDTMPLEIEQEKGIIQQALGDWLEQGLVELCVLERGLVAEIGQTLRSFRPHVFHFVGHGQVEGEEAYVVLEDEEGRARLVGPRAFREFFLGSADTRLAVFNACQLATTSATQPLAGLAPQLLQRNLSAVVAMQYPISDRTAAVFSREFYRSLALGYPVEAAMAEARKGILLEVGSEAADWAIPVLFLRAQDGRLFELAPQEEEARPEVPPPPEPALPPAMAGPGTASGLRFVGREAELTYFADKLATGHLAVISGMPGIGKTSLAAVLASRLSDPGKVFWHTFHEGESLEEVIWKLAGFLYWQGRRDVWEMLQGGQQSGGQPPPPAVILDYVLQELRGRRFLLCLDDLDLMGDDPLLEHALERMHPALQAGDLALIVTAQRVPPSMPAGEFRVLTGLTLPDTTQLLAQRGLPIGADGERKGEVYRTAGIMTMQELMSTDLVANLHDRTEGNPTLLTLAADALQRASAPTRFLFRLFEVENVERFLMKEVDDGLAEEERAVMTAVAALLGYPGTRGAIEAVLEGRNVRRPLRELSQRHLLNTGEGEAELLYSMNSILRYFYYDLLSRRERQAMHLRAAGYYASEEPDTLKAALHFESAGEHQQAARLATADVWALINQGQARPLGQLLARFTAQQLDAELWALVQITQGQVHDVLGEGEPAKGCFREALAALEALPQSPARQKYQARACRGMARLFDGEDLQEALNWVRRGLEVVGDADRGEEADLHLIAGSAQIGLGDYDAALASVRRGLDLLPEGFEQMQIMGLISLGTIYSCQGDMEAGNAYTLQALELSRQVKNYFKMLGALSNLGIDKYYGGDWGGARQDLERALELAGQLGDVEEQIRLQNCLGTLQTNLGDHGSALQTLTQAIEAARRHQVHYELVYLQGSLAELQIQRGDWQAAQKAAQDAEQLAVELGVRPVLPQVYSFLAQVHLALGDPEAALGHARQAVGLAQELEMSVEEGIGRRALGQSLLAGGQPDEAQQALADSLTLLGDETPFEAARTEVQWGLALLRAGKRQEGEERLERARATFERLGARHDLAVVDEILQGEA